MFGKGLPHGNLDSLDSIIIQVMLTVFFEFNGITLFGFLSQGESVNNVYYQAVLQILHGKIVIRDQSCGETTYGSCNRQCVRTLSFVNSSVLFKISDDCPPYSPD